MLGQRDFDQPLDPPAGETSPDPDPRYHTANAAAGVPRGARNLTDDADRELEVDLRRYVRMVYRRRWTAATVFVLVMTSVGVYALTATRIYESRARLLIEAENQNVVAFEPLAGQDQGTDTYYQTQYKLLEGRALAARTLEALNLWDNPLFATPGASGGFGAVGQAIRSVMARATPAAPAAPADQPDSRRVGETLRQSQAIDAFLARLVVSPVKGSRLVDLRFQLPDPVLAADIANSHARNYIEQSLEFKLSDSKEASGRLQEQLAEQRKKLDESEAVFQKWREQNDGVSMEDRQNIVVQRLTDLSAAVTRAKTERIEKEARYRQVQGIQANPSALDTFPAIQENAFIQGLKTQLADLRRQRAQLADQLGDLHPDMIKVTTAIRSAEEKLQVEIEKVVGAVRNDYLAAQSQEQRLGEALEAQKRVALDVNGREIDGNVLKRDAESNRQLYDGLLQRAKETGVSSELKSSNIRLVDLAEVPRAPVRPNNPLLLLVGLLGGSLLAVGLAVAFESLDDRIKTPDDIKVHLGLPMLGLVPRIAPKLLGARPLMNNGVPPAFSEAYRTIRTNVVFSSAHAGPNTIVVTSTVAGEGKTVAASNLAVGIAQTGEEVLLIDTDLRRPRVHSLFGVRQEPGLSNLLIGNAKARAVIHQTGIPGLLVLPAGYLPPNPAELLGSPRFRYLLTNLGERIRWIILDCPPVLAVTDATVLAQFAQGVVLVVGAEMASRQAAALAVERLQAVNGRIVGAVLNRVDVDRHRYYYAPHYRSDGYYLRTNAS